MSESPEIYELASAPTAIPAPAATATAPSPFATRSAAEGFCSSRTTRTTRSSPSHSALMGKILASSRYDHTILLWDVATGQPRRVSPLRGHTQTIRDLAFIPGGNRLASVGDDHTVRLWDPVLGQEIITLRVNPAARQQPGVQPGWQTLDRGRLWWLDQAHGGTQ